MFLLAIWLVKLPTVSCSNALYILFSYAVWPVFTGVFQEECFSMNDTKEVCARGIMASHRMCERVFE